MLYKHSSKILFPVPLWNAKPSYLYQYMKLIQPHDHHLLTWWQEARLQEIRGAASLRTLKHVGKTRLVVTGSETACWCPRRDNCHCFSIPSLWQCFCICSTQVSPKDSKCIPVIFFFFF
jgi:hypothetical protein